jgi:hypothetical protein
LLVGGRPLVLLVEQAERDFFEGVAQAGDRRRRRLVDKQMDMVFLSGGFAQAAVEAPTWVSEANATFAA